MVDWRRRAEWSWDSRQVGRFPSDKKEGDSPVELAGVQAGFLNIFVMSIV